jgi:hypothetical protein
LNLAQARGWAATAQQRPLLVSQIMATKDGAFYWLIAARSIRHA